MTQAYVEDDLARLVNVARTALTRWDIPTDADVELLNLSENATFAVADPNTRTPLILRVGRPEYSTVREVDSELSWIEALAGDRAVLTAPVRRARDGSRVVEISVPELPAARPCVVFGFVPGKAAPEDADLVSYFRVLGELAAKLHGHAQSWQPPQEFQRRRWDYETTIGDRPHWGAWEDGIGVGVSERKLLQRLQRVLEQRLANYGTGPERFGLVHADLRLDNVLFDGPDAYVIDFDDCGWSWFMYDLAACLTFIEDRPDLPALTTSWLAGYRGVAPLEDEAEAIIPTMIMLRRLLVLAWIGSHAETPLAKAEGVAYTEGTCWLAGRYLGGDGLGI